MIVELPDICVMKGLQHRAHLSAGNDIKGVWLAGRVDFDRD